MTTPQPEFDASSAGSRLLGTNGLQAVVDKLTQAVDKLASVASQMSSAGPGGTSTSTFGSTGQTFTFGNFPKMNSMAPSNSGPGGYSGSNVTAPMSMGSNPGQTLQQAGGAMAGQAMSALAPSSGQFSTQITMNQYAAMSTLGMNPGSNLGAGMRAMYNQAFGTYGGNLNAIALNAGDAAQGYSTLQNIAANPYVGSTALGRAGYSAYSGLGYANPSLGAAGSAAAAQQLYSPSTSVLMRMYGYGTTPRALGGIGQPTQMGQLAQSMFQRWYGKGSVSQGTLNAGLANGGKDAVSLGALGLNTSTYGPALQMYNKLFQQGVSANQANAMLTAASKNQSYDGQSAQKLLSNKYGISTSDLQKMKDSTAVGTSTTSGEMSAFDSALSGATTAVQKFDTAMSKLLGSSGLGNFFGGAHGITGTLGSIGGPLGSIANSAIGVGMGMLSRLGGAGGSGGAGGGASAGGSGTPGSSTTTMSRQVGTAIKDAESQLGRPYVWGGANPAVGFDCSGLVEWAYGQAGVKLPRTSQEQWAALQNRSVPLSKVRAGDIVFSSGSDGTFDSPGHEAMMISNNQIIEAPYTGANIRIRAFNAGEWQHAGRPSGSMNGGGGFNTGTSSNGNSPASTSVGAGNGGLGLSVGTYGSSNEAQNIAAALLGGSMTGYTGAGMGSVGNGQGSGSVTTPNVSSPNNASASQAQAVAKKLAAAYGWSSGAQWDSLVKLWNDESGWRWNAQNASGAYGIPQALPGSKMSSAGADWRTSAATQEKWGLSYIQGRYGSPSKALAHENMVHWYADGTPGASPGFALVGERGPELVRLSGGQQIANAKSTRDILSGQSAKTAQSPWSTGTAAQLVLAAVPQNSYGRSMGGGSCTVQLNMPPGAIVVHTQGSATDVSNATRQIMQGVSQALADNETVRQIMEGVTG